MMLFATILLKKLRTRLYDVVVNKKKILVNAYRLKYRLKNLSAYTYTDKITTKYKLGRKEMNIILNLASDTPAVIRSTIVQ